MSVIYGNPSRFCVLNTHILAILIDVKTISFLYVYIPLNPPPPHAKFTTVFIIHTHTGSQPIVCVHSEGHRASPTVYKGPTFRTLLVVSTLTCHLIPLSVWDVSPIFKSFFTHSTCCINRESGKLN